jgi:hypothetical protein
VGVVTSVFQLSTVQLQQLIRARSADTVQVVFSRHVELRMKQRQILRPEVLEVLRRGRLGRTPEPNLARASLECRMQRFVAGREIGVVVALNDDDPGVLVVTALAIGG